MNSGVTLESFQTLHDALAKTLLKKIQSGECSASDLKEAREFLKDNGIDGVKKEGGALDSLTKAIQFSDPDEDVPLRVVNQ
jgi:hypothetical protein